MDVFIQISNLNVEAVMFFFFLSGFSICLSVKNGLPITKSNFNNYAYRRLKRILPLYYFAILFAFLCGYLTKSVFVNDDFSVKNLLGNIVFLQCSSSYKGNWFAPYGDNGPLWSLSFEMFYYFLLPVFLSVMLKMSNSNKLTASINKKALLVSFFISLVCVFINKQIFLPYIAFAALFYVWYAGFFIAGVYLEKEKDISGTIILLLALIIVTGIIYYLLPAATGYKLLVGAIVSAGFYMLYLVRKKLPLAFINTSESMFNFLFYKIGTGSYALYLLHYPLLMILKQYEHLQLYQLVTAILLLSICCILLENYFANKKWLFLKLPYSGIAHY